MITLTFSFPLALSLLPRGNAFHEIINLPAFWLGLFRVDTSSMKPRKIHYGDHHRQYFLYIPPASGTDAADKVIVYFHGGGWKFGKPEQFLASVKVFHDAGYPLILPSLRRTPHYDYYDMRDDLNQILLRIRQFNQQEGRPNEQVVVGGMSAGGNLAALLCYDHHHLSQLNISPTFFAGLLVLGAPLDLEKMQDSLLLRAYAGPRGKEKFHLANPLEHLRKHGPLTPVFCVHGQADGLVAYHSALSFVKTFEEIQPEKIRFVSLESGTHLEAAAWGHTNAGLKREILSWLKNL
jgi:acetyl esterase/lipase